MMATSIKLQLNQYKQKVNLFTHDSEKSRAEFGLKGNNPGIDIIKPLHYDSSFSTHLGKKENLPLPGSVFI